MNAILAECPTKPSRGQYIARATSDLLCFADSSQLSQVAFHASRIRVIAEAERCFSVEVILVRSDESALRKCQNLTL